ncbi:NYN domain-containing protein [Micromonospora sp. NPDC049559]|uniref:NYN domain-containing protein n=1 Tax=Micromonospora sp. NPDC049559 TaxID=3155923 RepID=UPI003447CE36
MNRVIVYVDGFNLYHGLKDKHARKYHWLDLETLATSLLRPGQTLVQVRYFTARIRNQPASERRQNDYLSALAAHCPNIQIVEGRFQERLSICRSCHASWTTYEEKETDVNLALAIAQDAALDRFDTAILISGDADLRPALRVARELGGSKRIIVAFPPRRRSDALREEADACFTIGDAKIRNAQLPEKVMLKTGLLIERPAYWRGR